MGARATAMAWQVARGWSDHTLLDVLCDYIDSSVGRGEPDDLDDYLSGVAADEDAAAAEFDVRLADLDPPSGRGAM